MNTPMHILIIPSWYPRFVGDIGGSFFREQALALRKSGFKVGILFPEYRSLKDWKGIFNKPYGLKFEDDCGLLTYRWHAVVFFPKLNEYNTKKWVEIGLKLFEKYIKENGRPDVIHVQSMIKGAFLANAIYEKYDIPFVITEHSSNFLKDNVELNNITVLKEIAKKSSRCLAVSEVFKNKLNEVFDGINWEYVPNIVNDIFVNADIITKKNNEYFTYCSISLLTKNKRIDLLIDSFLNILKEYPNSKLVIIGDGSEKNNLIDKVNALKLKKNIEFLGLLDRNSILQILQTIDCLVIASEFETFGVVAVEALGVGKPVVATKCGGPESIINPRVGYLVKKNSLNELTNGMLKIQKNYEKFLPNDIRDYCLNNFGEKVVVERLKKIYQESLVLKKNNG